MTASTYQERLVELIATMTEEEQKTLLQELERKQTEGQRKQEREACLLTVNYSINDRAYQNYIQDISSEGVFIETRESFSVGDDIFMTITYIGNQRPFKIEGQVARTDANGIGIRFKKVSQVQEEILTSIIRNMSRP